MFWQKTARIPKSGEPRLKIEVNKHGARQHWSNQPSQKNFRTVLMKDRPGDTSNWSWESQCKWSKDA